MTAPLGQIIAGAAAAGEVTVLALAGIFLGLRFGLSFAESAVYGAVGTMMALSFLFQVTFLTALPMLGGLVETLIVTIAAIYLLMETKRQAPGVLRTVYSAIRINPMALTGFFLVAAWLGWNTVAIQPSADQWASLWPVLDIEMAQRLVDPGPFLNHRILSHLILRYHTHFGLGLFGLLAYCTVGAGTYALARRYAWPKTSLTVAMIVLSAPRLVMQAATPGLELIPAATVLFALLALYRTVEQPTLADLLLLAMGIAFAVSDNPMGVTAPIILIALSGVVLFRRHGGRLWWRLIAEKPGLAMLVVAPLGVFSQAYQISASAASKTPYIQNPDGIIGGAANLVRYFLESVHFTSAADSLCRHWIGVSPAAMIDRFYATAVFPFCGARGAAASFAVTWHKGPAGVWFGPLWFLLVLPAWLYAMVRGPRRLKAVAVSLAGYVYLASLIPAWVPGNASMFTVFFTSVGFMTAYLLPPWHFTGRRRWFVQMICLALMAYAVAHMTYGAF